MSLASAIGAGHIIFLTGIDATGNKVRTDIYFLTYFDFGTTLTNNCFVQGGCVAVAAFLQYFLMATFCWMLVEGIYLYLFVVKVYNIGYKMRVYQVISWGKNNQQHTVLYCN